MRILFVLVALFALAGCENMEWTVVSDSGHNYYHPHGHISYTLGYYSGSHYNGYSVYGSHGHRYYYAPRYYSHHRYYSAPPVVVVHQHVHTSRCYARGGHSYVAPRYTPPAVTPRHRRAPPAVTHNRTPPRAVPPQVRNDRREDRQDRNDRRRNPKQKRK